MRPDYISVSQINTYLACPRQYSYSYLEDAEPTKTSSSLVLGSAVHASGSVLYRSMMDGKTVTEKELGEHFSETLSALRDNNPPIQFNEGEDFDTMRAQGVGLVSCLFRETPRDEVVTAVDLELLVPLRNSKDEELALPLKAILDRVVRVNGSVMASDLKTAAKKYPPEQIAHDHQATAYCWALYETGQAGETQTFRWEVLLKGRKKQSMITYRSQRGRDHYNRFFAIAENVLKQINAGNGFNPVAGWRCKSCPHGEACKNWCG